MTVTLFFNLLILAALVAQFIILARLGKILAQTREMTELLTRLVEQTRPK